MKGGPTPSVADFGNYINTKVREDEIFMLVSEERERGTRGGGYQTRQAEVKGVGTATKEKGTPQKTAGSTKQGKGQDTSSQIRQRNQRRSRQQTQQFNSRTCQTDNGVGIDLQQKK